MVLDIALLVPKLILELFQTHVHKSAQQLPMDKPSLGVELIAYAPLVNTPMPLVEVPNVLVLAPLILHKIQQMQQNVYARHPELELQLKNILMLLMQQMPPNLLLLAQFYAIQQELLLWLLVNAFVRVDILELNVRYHVLGLISLLLQQMELLLKKS